MRLPTWVVRIRSVLRFIAIRLLSIVTAAGASQGSARAPKTTARARGPALFLYFRAGGGRPSVKSEARSAWRAWRTACAGGGPWFHGQQAFALHALARELARPADRFRLLARLLFGGFFVMAAKLHFAEDALALHLLLQRLERLVDVVVTDENLHAAFLMLPMCLMYRSPPIRNRSATARAPHDVGVYQNQREESIAVLTSCHPRASPGLLRSDADARLRAAWPLRRRQAQAHSRRAAPR